MERMPMRPVRVDGTIVAEGLESVDLKMTERFDTYMLCKHSVPSSASPNASYSLSHKRISNTPRRMADRSGAWGVGR